MALVIALGAIGGFSLRNAVDDTSSSRRNAVDDSSSSRRNAVDETSSSRLPQRAAPDEAARDFQPSGAAQRSGAAPAPRTSADAGLPRSVVRSSQPLAPAVDASRAIDSGLDVEVNAPTQAANGDMFDVSVGLSGNARFGSARFRVTYDAQSLDVVEIVDASGTALGVVPEGGNSVVLEMDASQAARAPVVRFTARVDRPQTIDLAVAAEAWDVNGTALAVRAGGSYPILLVP